MMTEYTSSPWLDDVLYDPSFEYITKVLAVEPSNVVGMWAQNDESGAVSFDYSIYRRHGVYTDVDLGQEGVPGTNTTAAAYDGVASLDNIDSAGFGNVNLLENPGLETAGAGDPDFWANWDETAGTGTLANEVVIVHEGLDSCKMTAGATFNTGIRQSGVDLVPGTRYRLRFWTYGDGVNAGEYRLYDNSNGAYIIPQTTTGVTAAAWGAVSVEFTAPDDCVLATLWIDCAPVNGAITYFDAFEIRRMNGFLGDEFTVLMWIKVNDWESGIEEGLFRLLASAAGGFYIYRPNTFDYGVSIARWGEGAVAAINVQDISFPGYFSIIVTASESADEMKAYLNGIQDEDTETGFTSWFGNLSPGDIMVIGAGTAVPTFVHDGSIAMVTVWNKALSDAQGLDVGTPPEDISSALFFATGDSKATGFAQYLRGTTGGDYYRVRKNGYGVDTYFAEVDALAAKCGNTPLNVLLNLGSNDMLMAQAVYETNYGNILDNFHARWPDAKLYLVRPWVRGRNAEAILMAGYIDNIISTRSSFAFLGPNESVFLENGDNGVTYTDDGIHPNNAGYILTSAEWATILGY